MSVDIKEIFYSIVLAFLAVTVIDVFGSITSRKWNYNYAYLTPLSLAVYTLIGYCVSKIATLDTALMIGSVIGIYYGTIGWRLAIMLDAKMGSQKQAALNADTTTRVVSMIMISVLFGFLGAMLAR